VLDPALDQFADFRRIQLHGFLASRRAAVPQARGSVSRCQSGWAAPTD